MPLAVADNIFTGTHPHTDIEHTVLKIKRALLSQRQAGLYEFEAN